MPIAPRDYTLVPLVGLALFTLCLIRIQPDQHRSDSKSNSSIDWKPYSEIIKNIEIGNGRKVLVFVYAELNPESEIALIGFDTARASAICDSDDYEALLLRYDDWNDPRIRSIWNDVGHTKKPFVVLYSQNELPQVCDPMLEVPLCR